MLFRPFVAADCLSFMQNGCELMKIRSNSRQYQRFFTIDEDLSTLRWRPSSKKPEKAKSKFRFYAAKQSRQIIILIHWFVLDEFLAKLRSLYILTAFGRSEGNNFLEYRLTKSAEHQEQPLFMLYGRMPCSE